MGEKIGYRRVSTPEQRLDRQLEGMTFDKLFDDYSSGKNIERPQFEEMMLYIRNGDELWVHSLDRFARNMYDLQTTIRKLTDRGVTVHFLTEKITFTKGVCSPMNELIFNLLGSFAQFERELARERQRQGIALAKARGVYQGRSKCLTEEQVKEMKEKLTLGIPKRRIAKDFKVTRQTIYRYLKQ